LWKKIVDDCLDRNGSGSAVKSATGGRKLEITEYTCRSAKVVPSGLVVVALAV
jgi:hypothetical protein